MRLRIATSTYEAKKKKSEPCQCNERDLSQIPHQYSTISLKPHATCLVYSPSPFPKASNRGNLVSYVNKGGGKIAADSFSELNVIFLPYLQESTLLLFGDRKTVYTREQKQNWTRNI